MPTTVAAPAGALRTRASSRSTFWGLVLGTIGVVYGDIGTSPLYAFREAINAAIAGSEGAVLREPVLGILSLILWALIIIVSLKYVLILLRADNGGEGGTLALMALAQRALGNGTGVVALCGIASAALFYGDAMITPALSVLSAIEGLKVVTPAFEHWVVPLTVVILLALFAFQATGTAKVAAFFGPVMIIWFLAIAVTGLIEIGRDPEILLAFNPYYGVRFLAEHGLIGLITLGAVFLAVTGAEALYADLGHFGRKPIRTAWAIVVFPSLALNYLGQGALVLVNPGTLENPFFMLYPDWARLPMVVLATAATVIASQAVITGTYSMTQQAIQLGLLPRLEIRHTSEAHYGQIYMPRVNTFLLIGVLLLVGMFRSSSALASAYGIAVSGTMVVTGAMAFVVIWKVWHWSLAAAVALMFPFLFIDLTFLSANLIKVFEGGWVPLALAIAVMTIMYTWQRGTKLLFDKTRRQEMALADLVRMLEKEREKEKEKERIPRVPGTAVFLTSTPDSAPTALLHSLKHYKVLHGHNVILTVKIEERPRVDASERVSIEHIGRTFTRVTLRFGFMDNPNVPRALAIARKHGWSFDIMSTSFFLSRRALKPAARSGMPRWQDRLFIMLTRVANDATDYFQIPTGRVVEVGTQVTI